MAGDHPMVLLPSRFQTYFLETHGPSPRSSFSAARTGVSPGKNSCGASPKWIFSPAVAGNRLWGGAGAPSLSVGEDCACCSPGFLPRGIFDPFALTYRKLPFHTVLPPWSGTLGRLCVSVALEPSHRDHGKSRVGSDFRALQISSRRTLRASLQDQTMVRARMSLRGTPIVVSQHAAKENTHCAQSLGARDTWLSTIRQHL